MYNVVFMLILLPMYDVLLRAYITQCRLFRRGSRVCVCYFFVVVVVASILEVLDFLLAETHGVSVFLLIGLRRLTN